MVEHDVVRVIRRIIGKHFQAHATAPRHLVADLAGIVTAPDTQVTNHYIVSPNQKRRIARSFIPAGSGNLDATT